MDKSELHPLLMALLGVGLLCNSVAAPAMALKPALQPSRQCRPQISLLPRNVAVILRTASTNTACERFLVAPSGQISFTIGNRTGQGTLTGNRRKAPGFRHGDIS